MHSVTVVLAVFLAYFSQQVTAGGSLNFLTLSSYQTVPSGDDTYSDLIPTDGDFVFDYIVIPSVYVSTNGYISMGEIPATSSPSIPGTYPIVSPYGANIDTRRTGTVRYTEFTSSDPQMSTVSDFIQYETKGSFVGTSMMVAEWDGVARFSGSYSVTSTFQCVLITDGSASYAVFIYECGGMGWGGATIGWAASATLYGEHTFSGINSDDVGSDCQSSVNYTTIIYRLPVSNSCESHDFTCNNGYCISDSDVCDEFEDCNDGSDEDGCPDPAALIIGLSVGLPVSFFFLFFCISVQVSMPSIARGTSSRRSSNNSTTRTRTTLVRESAPVTVRTMDEETSFTAPVPHTIPTPYSDGYGDAPPAYDAATAFPPLPPQVNQGFSNPVTGYPPQPSAPYPNQDTEQPLYPSAPPPYM